MATAMTILIALAAACLVAAGFLGPREPWDIEGGSGVLARMRKRRERLLRAIKDIELERQSGKLSEEEFRALRNDFKVRAVQATKDLDRVRKARLRSLASRRKGISPSLRNRIEALVRAAASRAGGGGRA